MEIVDYAEQARSTAVYPQADKYIYPSLGVGGEIGELCEKLDKISWMSPVHDQGPARKEVGDVLWYIAAVCYDANLSMKNLIGMETFEELEEFTNYTESIGSLAGKAGVICELAKKCIRDDGRQLTEDRRNHVRAALANLLLCLSAICNSYGISIAEAASDNLAKLQDRKNRGVLGGSGDNR